MSTLDLEGLINYPNEERWLEFKHSTPWSNRRFRAKIVKTILGLSNVRNGGWIIIGKDNDGTPSGMSQVDFDSYNQDDMKTIVDNYADPLARFDLLPFTNGGLRFLIIKVYEFDEIPVVCKKEYSAIMRKGALYTRSTGKPETIEVPSQTEMREILKMAKTKAVRLWFEEMAEVGAPIPPVGDSDDRYKEEISDLR